MKDNKNTIITEHGSFFKIFSREEEASYFPGPIFYYVPFALSTISKYLNLGVVAKFL